MLGTSLLLAGSDLPWSPDAFLHQGLPEIHRNSMTGGLRLVAAFACCTEGQRTRCFATSLPEVQAPKRFRREFWVGFKVLEIASDCGQGRPCALFCRLLDWTPKLDQLVSPVHQGGTIRWALYPFWRFQALRGEMGDQHGRFSHSASQKAYFEIDKSG